MKRLLLVLSLLFGCLLLPAKNMKIQFGPWLQQVDEHSFTVLWVSADPLLAWVEVAPDDGTAWNKSDRSRHYQVADGRRVADTFHEIRVSGLQPGTRYRYRIGGRSIKNDDDAYDIHYGSWQTAPSNWPFEPSWTVRTLDTKAPTCRFSMVNDIHFDKQSYAALLKDLPKADPDFVVLNGDIVSHCDSFEAVADYYFSPVAKVVACYPFVIVRGNHETRGRAFQAISKITRTPTGRFYYTFRQGPVGFIVLDSGEDKPDSSVEYSGYADYDSYRQQELAWLEQAVNDPDFASAPQKVCLIHIATRRFPDAWHGQDWVAEHFTPILERAGVQLMLSGHHHMYIYVPAGTEGANFPIVVNNKCERLDFEADGTSFHLKMYDPEGKLTHELDF